jgi:hypothetical protein
VVIHDDYFMYLKTVDVLLTAQPYCRGANCVIRLSYQ